MKHAALLLLLCLCSKFLAAQVYIGQHHYLPFEDTSKNICSMRTSRYKATLVNGKLVLGKKTDETLFFYDIHGNLVKRILIDPVKNGKFNPPPGEIVIMQHAFNNSVIVNNKCRYDTRGNLVEMPHDPLIYTLSGKFTYNDKNQLTGVTQFNSYKGNVQDGTVAYNYDDKGRLIEKVETSGNKLNKVTFEYDNAGRKLRETYTDENAHVQTTRFVYDTNCGKLFKTIDSGQYRNPQILTYKYDSLCREVQVYSGKKGRHLHSFTVYNASGYQFTELIPDKKIVQTINRGSIQSKTFFTGRPETYAAFKYNNYGDLIERLEGSYNMRPGADTSLGYITVDINKIKYRKKLNKPKELAYPKKFVTEF